MNSADLKFDKAVLEYTTGSRLETTSVALNEESEVATLSFGEELLKVGSAKLFIEYTGELNDKLKGFYRSKYIHPSGEVRYAATTQFEV